MKTLIITDEETKPLLSIREVMEAVEDAFKEKGLGYVQMPPKPYLFFKEHNGDLRVMLSYLERMEVSAVKVVNSHPSNPSSYGLPTVMATIILVDPKNGAPLAVMGGSYITAMRTGAAGGIAAKYLAREDTNVAGLVGAGRQARTQLMALLSVYEKLEEVRVCDKLKEARRKFIDEIGPKYANRCELIPVGSVKEAVEGTDVVVTATPSREPIVMNDWVEPGMHLTCIGADAPGKEELDPRILARAKIVVDDWEQASHCGEVGVPLSMGLITEKDVWGDICEIVAGLKAGRVSEDEVTVFTSTGLAIQDAVTAKIAYEKAVSKGVGRFIELV